MSQDNPRLAFVASDRPEAKEALIRLENLYGAAPEREADVIVALGGDGFMLETLHRTLPSGQRIYGMNRGSVGFLMNDYQEEGLLDRIRAAELAIIHPLRMRAIDRPERPGRRWPSTRSICSARPIRPLSCGSRSTARNG